MLYELFFVAFYELQYEDDVCLLFAVLITASSCCSIQVFRSSTECKC